MWQDMNRYQELTFLGEEETFFGKKAGDRVGVGGCSEDEGTSHQDQGPFVTSTFSGQPLPQPQPRSTCKSLARYTLDSMPEHVICCGEVCMPVCF